MKKNESGHWIENIAKQIIGKEGNQKNEYNIATGISPSGYIHLGNLREILTGYFIELGLEKFDKKVNLFFFIDDYDGLRKVLPNIKDQEMYRKLLGHPLSEIPSPFKSGESYADTFINDFMDALDQLNIKVIPIRASNLYKQGAYNEEIINVLLDRENIIERFNSVIHKPLEKDWQPINVKCEQCESFMQSTITNIDIENKVAKYICECGCEGSQNLTDGTAMLKRRLVWPIRQNMFNIDIEAFGKDHGSTGGSYTTAQAYHELKSTKTPHHTIYERISLIGKGEMSSSKGNLVKASDIVASIPGSILKYYIGNYNPMRSISFDIKSDLIRMFQSYQNAEGDYFDLNIKNYCFETINGSSDIGLRNINYVHLINVLKYYDNCNEENLLTKVSGIFPKIEIVKLKEIISYIRNMQKYGFLQDSKKNDNIINGFNERDHTWIQKTYKCIEAIEERNSSNISRVLQQVANDIQKEYNVNKNEYFQLLYMFLFKEKVGPSLSDFISMNSKEMFLDLLHGMLNKEPILLNKLDDQYNTIAGRVLSKNVFSDHIELNIKPYYGNIYTVIGDKEKLLDINVGNIIQGRGQLNQGIGEEIRIKINEIISVTKNTKLMPNYATDSNLYRRRLIDHNAESITKVAFELPSKIRGELSNIGYKEVNTPILLSQSGSGQSYPFVTEHRFSKKDLYLRKTLEFELRKLVLSGENRIYEIGKVFTNEGKSKTSLPERHMCEGISPFQNSNHGINEIKQTFSNIINSTIEYSKSRGIETIDFTQFHEITFQDFVQEIVRLNMGSLNYSTELLDKYLKKIGKCDSSDTEVIKYIKVYESAKRILPGKINLVMRDFPEMLAPFAKKVEEGSNYTHDFKFYLNGLGVLHGCEDENNVDKIRDTLQRQLVFGIQHKYRNIDEDYLELLSLGCPPSFSWGFGLERLLKYILKLENVNEVSFFRV